MQYADPKDNQEELENWICPADQPLYSTMKYTRNEGAFDGRVFVVYQIKNPKEVRVLGTYEVTSMRCDSSTGVTLTIEDDNFNEQEFKYIPTRFFGHDLFVSVPVVMKVICGLELEHKTRSIAYGIRLVQADSPDNESVGNQYILTLNRFRSKYPEVDLTPYAI